MTINNDRFEVIDGVLRIKDNAFLQHPQDDQLEVTITFTDREGASRSTTQMVTTSTESNETIWTNTDFVLDVNRSGDASVIAIAIDALVIIHQLN